MKRFFLIDCNNFFVSCERVFNPVLKDKPVVVLSSNDGCIIARSNEAKKIGIKMGEPFFLVRELLNYHKVFVYSSNFALYSDISRRVMQILSDYAEDMEMYSIDEAFLHVPVLPSAVVNENKYYTDYAVMLQQRIKQNTGIPVSVGIGPTKTLAKIANYMAKKNSPYGGVFDIGAHGAVDDLLKGIEVAEIWGIGRKYAVLLQRHGIMSAYQLKNCRDDWVRKNLTIGGLKTVLELRGIPCFSLKNLPEPKKSIIVSRSFGKAVTDLSELQEAAAFHVTRAAEKLRAQAMAAQHITVFVSFSYHGDVRKFYRSYKIEMPMATSYTPDLIAAAYGALKYLYIKNNIYKKLGIVLENFFENSSIQINMSCATPDLMKQTAIMKTVDSINGKMGKNKIFFAASGVDQQWHAKKTKKSPAYTTNWHEILTIKI